MPDPAETDEAAPRTDEAATLLCADCEGRDYDDVPGECDRCGGQTIARTVRLCGPCSQATGDCAACLLPAADAA